MTAVDEGQMLLDDALSRVEAHAVPEWKEIAYRAGAVLSKRSQRWSADDLWWLIEMTFPNVTTHEPRALGPVIQQLKGMVSSRRTRSST